MTALQGFLLGLMVSWIPSLVFLACIAVRAGTRRQRRSVQRQSEVSASDESVVIDAWPRLFRGARNFEQF
jgi:hypothetical protein